MSRSSSGFGHVRCISKLNYPEGDLELLRLVFVCFSDVVQSARSAEHFIHLDRRRALGSNGQHEGV